MSRSTPPKEVVEELVSLDQLVTHWQKGPTVQASAQDKNTVYMLQAPSRRRRKSLRRRVALTPLQQQQQGQVVQLPMDL